MSSLWKQTWEDRISGTELIPLNQMFVGSTARCIADGCGEAQSCRIFLSLMSLHGFHDAHVSLFVLISEDLSLGCFSIELSLSSRAKSQ